MTLHIQLSVPSRQWFVILFFAVSKSRLIIKSVLEKSHSQVPPHSIWSSWTTTTTTKSLQSCPTLCNPTDSSPPGSPVPGILQARTLEWVAMSFSNARKWKVKVKSLSCVWLSATPWTAAHQSPPSMGFSRQEYWSGVPLPSPSWTRNLFFSKQFADEFYNQEKKLNTNLKRSETCQNLQLIKNMKSRELWIDEQSLLPSLMGCQSWRSPTCLLEIDRTLHCYVATLSFENGFIHNVSVYRSNHLSCLTRSLWYTIYYN